jgi:hypothetical protein
MRFPALDFLRKQRLFGHASDVAFVESTTAGPASVKASGPAVRGFCIAVQRHPAFLDRPKPADDTLPSALQIVGIESAVKPVC